MKNEPYVLLTAPRKIRKSLQLVAPSHIAVAYVGRNWDDYIAAEDLRQIIVSPTLGSNPKAIEEIASRIGWRNVFFLDNLHSKVFIGKEAAIFGSCNLSDNALAGVVGGKHEVAMLTHDMGCISTLRSEFERYRALARQAYPTQREKTMRLDSLRLLQRRAARLGLMASGSARPGTLDSFEFLPGQRLHVAWYSTAGLDVEELNRDVLSKARPETAGVDFDEYYDDVLECGRDDNVREQDWILQWRMGPKGRPAVASFEWMYVNDVIAFGSRNVDYPKIAVSIAGQAVPVPPFQLDAKARAILGALLRPGQGFDELLPTADETGWGLPEPDGVPRRFFEQAARRYKDLPSDQTS